MEADSAVCFSKTKRRGKLERAYYTRQETMIKRKIERQNKTVYKEE